jgi:hypothetical protein
MTVEFFIKRQAPSGDIYITIGDASEVKDCGLWNVTLLSTNVLEELAVSIFFYLEDARSRFIRDVDMYLPVCKGPHLRRP